MALCGAIGFEREIRDQAAGFRTHILLGIGAALFTLVSAYGFEPFTAVAGQSGGRSGIVFDPTRIAAQIVTGIGFLGAGAIIRQGIDIRGLTTAASLWATAAIGMAVGAGYYVRVGATTAVVIVALYLLRKAQSLIFPRLRTEFGVLTLSFTQTRSDISRVTEVLDDYGNTSEAWTPRWRRDAPGTRYRSGFPLPATRRRCSTSLLGIPGVQRVGISGLHGVE
ncbi:MAG: MgtC/SapB family protein [Actinomycetota bacterium]|nr:MgtC/SapB family protein [Actinomycetota bacterium]